jgi:hypothetical protein
MGIGRWANEATRSLQKFETLTSVFLRAFEVIASVNDTIECFPMVILDTVVQKIRLLQNLMHIQKI